MAAYTKELRAARMVRLADENMTYIEEFAERYAITLTAAMNIIIEHGIEVQRLMDDQRELVTAVVAGSRR